MSDDEAAGTSSSSIQLSDWQRRINAFTLYFIQNFVKNLSEYKNDAGPGNKKDKKEMNKTVGDAVNAFAEVSTTIPVFGSSISGVVKSGNIIASSGISAYKDHTHSKKCKNISKIFREIGDESLRLILIHACGDIFFSFQNQFTKVTDNSTKDDLRGMEKLANDAVNRIFDYISKKKDEFYVEAEFHHFITKGVIFGESKSVHTLKNVYSNEIWYTNKIFEKVFILKNSEQYIISGKKENGEKYGCRHPFQWERNELDSKLKSDTSVKYNKVTIKTTQEMFKLKRTMIFEHLKTLHKQILVKDNLLKQIDKMEELLKYIKRSVDKANLKENTGETVSEIAESLKNIPDIEKITELIEKLKNYIISDNQTRDENIGKTLSDIEKSVTNITESVKNIPDIEKMTELFKKLKSDIISNNQIFHNKIDAGLCNITKSLKNIPDENKMEEYFRKIGDKIDKNQNPQITKNQKPVWFNIKSPVKSFIGRKDELTKIHDLIQSKLTHSVVIQAATISGLGGIGKTELARMYFEKYKQHYYNVIWIDSETNESLKNSFITLSNKIGLPTTDNKTNKDLDIKVIVENIYEFIGKSSNLIIFDNAESYEYIKDFLPPSLSHNEYQKPYILFTSRNSNWDVGEEGAIGIINLIVFTSAEAYDYIKQSLNGIHATEDEINDLGEELGYLPLALSQAISYIKMENNPLNPFGIHKYLQIFTKSPQFEINKDRYQQTIMNTWDITIKKISKNPTALKIIQVMSFLSPDCLDFCQLFEYLNLSDEVLGKAIALLKDYSLITFDEETDKASIHRLLQVAIRNQFEMEKKDFQVLKSSFDLLNSYDKYFYSFKCNKEEYHSQIENLKTIIGYASKHVKLIEKFYRNVYYDKFTPLHFMAESGNENAIENIIKYIKRKRPRELYDIINKTNSRDYRPIDCAIENGNLNVIKNLKENKSKVSAKTIRLAHDTLQIDIMKCLSPLDVNYRLFAICLLKASKCGNLNHLNKFFNELNEVERKNVIQKFDDCFREKKHDYDFELNIDLFKSIKIMKFLIKNNFHNNLCAKNIISLIEVVIEYNHPFDIFEILVGKCPNINSSGEHNKTLFQHAVWYKRFQMVKYLKDKGASLNTDNDYESILHIAARTGNLEIVEYLIKNGADVHAVDEKNNTILHSCFSANCLELKLIKYLIEKKNFDIKAVNNDNETILHLAVKYDNLETVKYLIDKGVDINAVDEENNTILHTFYVGGCLDIIKYLIEEKHFNVKALNNDNETILHFALMDGGNLETVKCLIENGADVNAVDNNNNTILHSVFSDDDLEVIKYLIEEKHFNVKAVNNDNETILHFDLSMGDDLETLTENLENTVKYLIENGVDVNNTILCGAVFFYELETIKCLIKNGADVNEVDDNERTILHQAARNENSNIIEYFLSDEFNKKLDINAIDEFGETPIILAMFDGNSEVVQFLLSKKKELKIDTTFTFTYKNYPETTLSLFHVAIAANAVDIVKLIIKQDGQNIIEDDIVDGVNSLHIAVFLDSWKVQTYFRKLNKLFKDKMEIIKNELDKKGIELEYFHHFIDSEIFCRIISNFLYKKF